MLVFITIKICGPVTTDCLELVWVFEPCIQPFLSGYLNDQEKLKDAVAPLGLCFGFWHLFCTLSLLGEKKKSKWQSIYPPSISFHPHSSFSLKQWLIPNWKGSSLARRQVMFKRERKEVAES